MWFAPCCLHFLVLLLTFIAPIHSHGQDFVKTYHFDLKDKHMIPLPAGDLGDEFVAVGNLGYFDDGIHFVHLDNNGNVLKSLMYRGATSRMASFDFTSYYGSYYITALNRGLGSNDKIQLINVDMDGNIMSDILIGSSSGDGMYPIHTTEHNGLLYICGYVSPPISYPTLTDVTTPKLSFVLVYNPVTNTVGNCMTFESVNVPNNGLDYDMAMRATALANGNIMVTGGANVTRLKYDPATIIPPAPPTSNMYAKASGVMATVIDPTLTYFIKPPIVLTIPYGPDEICAHGHDVVEKDGIYFILGNDFYGTPSSPIGQTPAPIDYTFIAMDTFNFAPMGGGNKAMWRYVGHDYAWGLQPLPSLTGGDVLLAGMGTNLPQCDEQNTHSNFDAYVPFIADYNLNYNFGSNEIVVSNNYTRWYKTRIGTRPHTMTNSYHNTQQWLYNNVWMCNIAMQSNVQGHDFLSLTAPVANISGSSVINFKLIHGMDAMGTTPSCPESYTDCMDGHEGSVEPIKYLPSVSLPWATPSIIYNNVGFFSFLNTQLYSTNTVVQEYHEMDIYDCQGTGLYRIGGSEDQENDIYQAEVAPNPASTEFSLTIKGKGELLHVSLVDMTGRQIKTLYSGKLSDAPAVYPLNEISKGLYFVIVSIDKNKLQPIKLIVE